MKKPIIIKPENLTRIADEIAAAEGRATVRTITPEEIAETCTRAEKHLLQFSTKKAAAGTRIWCDLNGQNFPRAYERAAHHHTPQSTYFYAEYTGKDWRLLKVSRKDCYKDHAIHFEFTEATRADALDHLSRCY